jgi:hypothetical protein
MFGRRTKTTARHKPTVTLPIYDGPGVSPCCQVNPGQEHNLSCEHVSPELFRAYLGISEQPEGQ